MCALSLWTFLASIPITSHHGSLAVTKMQFKFGDANFEIEYGTENDAEEAARMLGRFIMERGPKEAIRKMFQTVQCMAAYDEKRQRERSQYHNLPASGPSEGEKQSESPVA
jgi:hypothetical protein